MQIPKRTIAALLLAAIAILLGPGARAQDQGAVADPSSQGEITISCPSTCFGVGGLLRRGDLAGLRLSINDSAAKPREVLVRIAINDADGDPAQFERSMTTNPGTAQPLWMYVRLPSGFGSTSVLNVTAYEAVESGTIREGERPALEAGKVIGAVRLVRPPVMPLRTDGLIGLVGARSMGLRNYEAPTTQWTWLPGGHEPLRIIARLDAETLPDRWMGLEPYEAIVWSEGSPTTLGSERASAIREWVQRGGHLIVVLPPVAQVWTDEANNPLADIVPRVKVQRQEGISLAPYRALIDRRDARDFAMPDKEVLQTMTPLPDAQPGEAIGILEGTAGVDNTKPWIVSRRLVGTGMVTLIGLDLTSRWMDRNGAPDPELFWHRILGRRGVLLSPTEAGKTMMRSRDPVTVDGFIPGAIAKRGQAAAGVLLGFVVFIAYWLLAGPPTFAVLKKLGWAKHGWVAFVAAAAVFTGVAWGGATLIRPAKMEAKHLTFLDHVYGQSIDHAHSWLSLLVPDYGSATITVGEPTARERNRFHNLLTPWEADDASGEGFTDARGYRIDCKNPDQATIPTRATVKQLQADWAGAPPWVMPHPVSADPESKDGAVRIAPEDAKSIVTGTLVHELPSALKSPTLIVNAGQKKLSRSMAGINSMWSELFAYSLDTWKPGTPLNLETITQRGTKDAPGKAIPVSTYFKDLYESGGSDQNGVDASGDALIRRLNAISFFTQIEPPEVLKDWSGGRVSSQRAAQRKYTHGMDLGRWFTEPCIIIVGTIGDSDDDQPSPVPLYVGNGAAARPVATAGRTVVRWVYPLGSRPPEMPAPGQDQPTLDKPDSGS